MERMNIIVSEKSWHQSMASDLSARLGCDFILIDSPESFNLVRLQQVQPRYVFFPQEIDAGPIYLKRSLSLNGTAQEIYERASLIIEDMICEIVKDDIEPVEQSGDPVVFERRRPEEGNLIHSKSIEDAYDLIRMLDADGYPHAFVEVGELVFRFTNADLDSTGLSANVQIERRPDIEVLRGD